MHNDCRGLYGHAGRFPSVALLISILCFAGSVSAQDDKVAVAIAGNSASIGSISTLYTKVSFKIFPAGDTDPNFICTAEYWREPGLIRCTEQGIKGTDTQIEYLVEKGEQRVLYKRPGPQPGSYALNGVVASEWRPSIRTDAWRLGLCGLPTFDSDAKPLLTVAQALQKFKFKGATSERLQKRPVVHLTFIEPVAETTTDGIIYDLWLDPSVNWMICKALVCFDVPDKKFRTKNEYLIDSFTEVIPGQFFPSKMTMRCEVNGNHFVTQVAEFTDTKLNTIKRCPFSVALNAPAATPFQDEIRGTVYVLGKDGKPGGKPMPLQAAAPATTVGTTPLPTTSPPTPTSRIAIVLMGSAVLLTLAAAVVAYRRRRKNSGD
ncbi:hypothetical protein [Fimbriiglobus ruber]|uniref:hypothetical protein n=1 Tax=Fimbriiglobus ruber TaxID=1908690 RepID=UPI001179E10C|nr:hypothetical protein [Fimbriiglobus ruber]